MKTWLLRVVSNAEQNLHINPDTGTVITDDPLDYPLGDPNDLANPNVVAVAYANTRVVFDFSAPVSPVAPVR